MRPHAVSFGIAAVLLVACSSNTPADENTASTPTSPAVSTVGGSAESSDQRFPDIIDAQPTRIGDTWTFAVTVSSPYDTPDQYADGWRILGPDGTVDGEHALDHDHATEQPFTRIQTDVRIPDGITSITIEGRDVINGYGGKTLTIDLRT